MHGSSIYSNDQIHVCTTNRFRSQSTAKIDSMLNGGGNGSGFHKSKVTSCVTNRFHSQNTTQFDIMLMVADDRDKWQKMFCLHSL